MENKLQMLPVRRKCALATHARHPRRIIMKVHLIHTHLSCRSVACTQETILMVTPKEELSFKKLQKAIKKDACL